MIAQDIDEFDMATWWQRAWRHPAGKIASILAIIAALAGPILWALYKPPPAGTPRGWRMSEAEIPEPPPPKVDAAWFAKSELFSTMPEPKPGDWLYSQKERGQSHKRYVYEEPNLPDETRDTLYILPIGDFASEGRVDLELIARACTLYFDMPTRVLPAWHPEPGTITSRGTTLATQWLTTDLLEAMIPRLPEDAYAMLGVTMTDIWPGKGWNFVFGSARLRDRVGIQSFVRYDPAFTGSILAQSPERDTIILRRALQVMTHEFGHMFGIRHCTAYMCNMNGSNSIREADKQPIHLCPVCLKKLQYATGFAPEARYEKLAAFYREHDLGEFADWIDARRAQVREE